MNINIHVCNHCVVDLFCSCSGQIDSVLACCVTPSRTQTLTYIFVSSILCFEKYIITKTAKTLSSRTQAQESTRQNYRTGIYEKATDAL